MKPEINLQEVKAQVNDFLTALPQQVQRRRAQQRKAVNKHPPWEVHFRSDMNDDDGMDVHEHHIYLNQNIIEKGGTYFGLLFALHEIYHAVEQNFLSKETAARLKAIGAEIEFVAMDIEADVMTALFMKKVYGWNFERYVEAYYQGQAIFKPPIGPYKLFKIRRFISSMNSIYKSYLTGHLVNERPYQSIFESDTKEKWVVITEINGRRFTQTIPCHINQQWRMLYEDGHKLNVQRYTERIISLVGDSEVGLSTVN